MMGASSFKNEHVILITFTWGLFVVPEFLKAKFIFVNLSWQGSRALNTWMVVGR